MLKDSRPHLEKTLANLDTVSAKMAPTIDNLNASMGKANNLVDHLDGVIVENRKEIHDTLAAPANLPRRCAADDQRP